MSGWKVETCTCGFGGGDVVDEFETEAAARRYAAYCDSKTDASVTRVWYAEDES